MLLQDTTDSTNALPVRLICRALSISRTTYYRLRHRDQVQERDTQLRERIQQIALEENSYGYRRITKALHRQGIRINHKRVLRLMREDNLLCLRKRAFVRTTNSEHNLPLYPNLAKGFTPSTPNQLWVSDITYIRLQREFVYLAVILDAFSRRVVGWELSRRIDTLLTLSALKKALMTRHPGPGLVHHSDRGVQYASLQYTSLLDERGIQISMSRKGNPYDNAFAESFMKTLKYEQVYLCEYLNLQDAYRSIRHFLEEVYNRKRLHSAIGYLPPEEFESLIAA